MSGAARSGSCAPHRCTSIAPVLASQISPASSSISKTWISCWSVAVSYGAPRTQSGAVSGRSRR